jgi:hypothetical protein
MSERDDFTFEPGIDSVREAVESDNWLINAGSFASRGNKGI